MVWCKYILCLTELEQLLESLKPNQLKSTVFVGDLNINLLSPSSLSQDILSTMFAFHLHQVVTKTTRVSTSSPLSLTMFTSQIPPSWILAPLHLLLVTLTIWALPLSCLDVQFYRNGSATNYGLTRQLTGNKQMNYLTTTFLVISPLNLMLMQFGLRGSLSLCQYVQLHSIKSYPYQEVSPLAKCRYRSNVEKAWPPTLARQNHELRNHPQKVLFLQECGWLCNL